MFADHNEQNLGEETGTGEHKQMFMFRTVSMIIVFVVLLVSSQAFEFVQRKLGKEIEEIEQSKATKIHLWINFISQLTRRIEVACESKILNRIFAKLIKSRINRNGCNRTA